ncbi:MAG: APC family permease, partial [Acetobacteraceae bacterium]
FLHTSRQRAPDHALLLTACLASLFLVQSALFGWAIGIVIRSFTVLVILIAVSAGALNVVFNRRFRDVPWAARLRRGPWMAVMAVLAIAISLFLLGGGLVLPHTPVVLQPWFQGVVAACVAALIYVRAQSSARRRGIDLGRIAHELPTE